jgi:hypothetical protein
MRNGFPASSLTLLLFVGFSFAQPPATENTFAPAPALPLPELSSHPATLPPGNLVPGPAVLPESSSCAPAACGCEDICRPCCSVCGPEGRFWASAEYLLWWFQGGRVPPLVTTSPVASGGVLGEPGTTVLFGGSRLDEDAHSGGRFTVGGWLNECQTIGLDADYFFLGSRSNDFTAGGNGLPGSQLIARPIVNAITGMETAEIVASPGTVAGTIHVTSSSWLQGAGTNLVANVCCTCCSRVDLFAGFRYLELREGIGITEDLAVNPDVPNIGGSTFGVADQFDTRNQFYGGTLGARAEYRWGNLFADLLGSVALGSTHEEIDIQGSTVITPPGGTPTTFAGGVLALPTNIGHYSRDRFAVAPEFSLHVGYQVTQSTRAFVGYSFLYLSNVVRPGDVIDRTVNLSQLPTTMGAGSLTGPARPAVLFKDTEFWAQGVDFGLEFRF